MDKRKAPDPGMTPKEAAKYLTVSRSTLYTLPIRYSKVGGRRVYRRTDLDAYLDLTSNRVPVKLSA
jgi:excisionase family DNA binding protein